jgi:hypothetical protein
MICLTKFLWSILNHYDKHEIPGLKIHGDVRIIFIWHNSGGDHLIFRYDSYETAAVAATYTTHNKHMGRTSMPSARIEPAILRIENTQTSALDRTATGIGMLT